MIVKCQMRHVTKSRNAVNAHMCLYSFCAQVSYFIARTARHLSAHPTNKARPLRLGGPRRASRASARPRRRACVCPPRAPAHARRMCPDPPRQVECTRQCGAGETLAARARPSMSRPDVSIKGSTLQASRRARSLISLHGRERGGENRRECEREWEGGIQPLAVLWIGVWMPCRTEDGSREGARLKGGSADGGVCVTRSACADEACVCRGVCV